MRIAFVIAVTLSFLLGCFWLYVLLKFLCSFFAPRPLEGIALLAGGISLAFVPIVLLFKSEKSVRPQAYFGCAVLVEIAAAFLLCWGGAIMLFAK
jgi:hypothetical protein